MNIILFINDYIIHIKNKSGAFIIVSYSLIFLIILKSIKYIYIKLNYIFSKNIGESKF